MRRAFIYSTIASAIIYALLTPAMRASAAPIPPPTPAETEPEVPPQPAPPAAEPHLDDAGVATSAPLAWCEETKNGESCFPPQCVEGKKMLMFYRAEWCEVCKQMENEVFSDPAVQARLSGYLLISIDVDANPGLAGGAKVRGTPTVDAFGGKCTFLRMAGLPNIPAKEKAAMFLRFLDAAEKSADEGSKPTDEPGKKPKKKAPKKPPNGTIEI